MKYIYTVEHDEQYEGRVVWYYASSEKKAVDFLNNIDWESEPYSYYLTGSINIYKHPVDVDSVGRKEWLLCKVMKTTFDGVKYNRTFTVTKNNIEKTLPIFEESTGYLLQHICQINGLSVLYMTDTLTKCVNHLKTNTLKSEKYNSGNLQIYKSVVSEKGSTSEKLLDLVLGVSYDNDAHCYFKRYKVLKSNLLGFIESDKKIEVV